MTTISKPYDWKWKVRNSARIRTNKNQWGTWYEGEAATLPGGYKDGA